MTGTRGQGCEAIEQLMDTALADGQPAATDTAVRRHLDGCSRCRRHAERLGDLMRTLKDEPVPDPGEAYWQQLPERVQRRLPGPARRHWALWGGLAAAAVLALILVRLPQPPGTQPGPDTGAAGTSATIAGGEAPLDSTTGGTPASGALSAQGTAAADALPQLDGGESDDLRCLLNDLLGPEDLFDLTGESWDLSDEEQLLLLESLRSEMENPA